MEQSRAIVKLKIAEHLELAKVKQGRERMTHLEKAIYLGCDDLEVFMDIVSWLIDVDGNTRKAYSIATLAPRGRHAPVGCIDMTIYHGKFDAYWALAAHYAGFHEEAYRIQKELIFYKTEIRQDSAWLDMNYSFYLNRINRPSPTPIFINTERLEGSNVAVLFIGQYRTFDRSYYNIYQNLLLPNNATAFIFCEDDKKLSKLVKIGKGYWGEKTIGACSVISERPADFKHLEEYLLKTSRALHPTNFRGSCATPGYITKSGSILEYYYYVKCYDLMLQYEKKHNIKFNIIVRSRLDIIIGPCLKLCSFFSELSPQRAVMADDFLYMACLGIRNWRAVRVRERPKNKGPINNLLSEIKSEKYIWTLGPNQVWIGKRAVMSQLYTLAYLYGKYMGEGANSFNSETQFDMFCKERGIYHFILEAGSPEEKHIRSRNRNLSLLKSPADPLDDDTIIWGFLRSDSFRFPEP